MLRQTLLVSVTTALSGASAGGCSAPPAPGSSPVVSSAPADDTARTIAAMKPPRRSRPAIAVVAQNEGTETTDFIVPWAVLTASGAADALAVAPEARTIRLTPALAVEPQATLAEFDQRYPDGADYVVVPKIEETAHPVIVAWIRSQAARGATIVGICSGVKTVAAAGLVDGRAATGHWYDIEELRRTYPTMRWVRDRRYVADRNLVTTTGVSASLPASLALVEAIAGPARAAAVAAEIGVASWEVQHESAAFRLEPETKLLIARNKMVAPETWIVPVGPGVDEIALAFMADAWSRTFRSRALAVGELDGPITTRRGLVLVPDVVDEEERATARTLPAPGSDAPAQALPASLEGIAAQYGAATASFVALQLEYAWAPLSLAAGSRRVADD